MYIPGFTGIRLPDFELYIIRGPVFDKLSERLIHQRPVFGQWNLLYYFKS